MLFLRGSDREGGSGLYRILKKVVNECGYHNAGVKDWIKRSEVNERTIKASPPDKLFFVTRRDITKLILVEQPREITGFYTI